jgi:hypothetical protein
MFDGSSVGEPKLALLRGRASEVVYGLISSSGVAGGTVTALSDADISRVLVVLLAPQIPTVLLLTMKGMRLWNDLVMQRRTQTWHGKITEAALQKPSDPNLRTLLEDFARTCRDRRGDRDESRPSEHPDADGGPRGIGVNGARSPHAPPPPTPIDRSA